MRFPALILSLLAIFMFSASAQAFVAEGDTRPHTNIAELKAAFDKAHRGTATLSMVGRPEMDRLATSFDLNMKPGFKVAVLIWQATGNVAVADDVPADALLIVLIGVENTPVSAGIYQIDQAKALADVKDILADPDTVVKNDPADKPPKTDESKLPPGIIQDTLDPNLFHATNAGMTEICKRIGLRTNGGFHVVRLIFHQGDRFQVTVLDGIPSPLPKTCPVSSPDGTVLADVMRDDGKDFTGKLEEAIDPKRDPSAGEPVPMTPNKGDTITPIPDSRKSAKDSMPIIKPKPLGQAETPKQYNL